MTQAQFARTSTLAVIVAWATAIAIPADAATVTHYEYADHDKPVRTWVGPQGGAALSDTTITYDIQGRRAVVRQRVAANQDDNVKDAITSYWYTWAGQVARTVRYGPGSTVDPQNPSQGNPSTDAITTNTYDKVGRLIQVEGPGDRKMEYAYDAGGNVTLQQVWFGSGGSDYVVTETDYDALNRAVKVTDPEGHYVVNRYDTMSRLRETTRYSAADARLAKEAWVYDSAGRQTRAVQFASTNGVYPGAYLTDRFTDTSYNSNGAVATTTTYGPPLIGGWTLRTTTYAYDGIGRRTGTTDPLGNSTVVAYDGATGRVASRVFNDYGVLGSRTLTYAYDDADRVTTETESSGASRTTTYAYDALDRRVSMTDADGVEVQYAFDLLGRQVRMTEAESSAVERVTDTIYDRLGRLIGLAAYELSAPQDPPTDWATALAVQGAQVTRYWFNLADDRLKIAYPDNTAADPSTDVVAYAYDRAGRVTSKTDQRAIQTDYTYDGRGLMLTKAAGTSERSVFEYDGLARMTAARYGTAGNPDLYAETTFAYDPLSNLVGETQELADAALTHSFTYYYNIAGDRSGASLPTGDSLSYWYDTLGRVLNINRTEGEAGFANLVTYTYTGQYLTKRSITTTEAVNIDLNLHYDPFRRQDILTNASPYGTGSVLLAGFGYEFDDVGNRLATYGDGNPVAERDVAYGYDDLHRLVSADYSTNGSSFGAEAFRYDLLGNRDGAGTGGDYGYEDSRPGGANIAYGPNNSANEYTIIDANTVGYDLAGNQTLDEHGISYEYDAENRLVWIFVNSNGTAGYQGGTSDVPYLHFAYDALGRRIVKEDHTGASVARTLYTHDGQRVVGEYDASGVSPVLTRYYVDGTSYIDEHVAVRQLTGPNAGEYYYVLKELYSVAGLANANGTLVEAYDYDAYGKVRLFTALPTPCDELGNVDGDCDVDMADFAELSNCYANPGNPEDCRPDVRVRLDFNMDGVITDADLLAFTDVYTGPQFGLFADGDWNSNGTLTPADVNAFVNICYSSPGGGFNTNGCAVFDFDGDFDVDIDDYGVLLALMSEVAPGASVTLAAADASPVNDYFFTGRSLDVVPHGGQRHQRYYYRARTYNTERFMQRDPLDFISGQNQYAYARNSPLGYVDWNGKSPTFWNPCGCRVHRQEIKWTKLRAAKNPAIGDNSYEEFIGHTWINCGGTNYDYPVIRIDPSTGAIEGFQDIRQEKSEWIWGTSKALFGKLKAGRGAGRDCSCVSCGDIKSCLDAVQRTNASCGYSEKGLGILRPPPGKMNCRYHITQSLQSCCLVQNLFADRAFGIGPTETRVGGER